ncbi:hypothetical protein DFP72DRAFT_482401 [Ephemerocybe angulata]|uniref:Uncharacterized protein n=1 Tax=Ephemerocybe angulata TaxID=980116 RepID=A0A8H6MFS4_9AGAR|nr:hypothetical protein DFP72DRAFT_482401 [Tulosesus angulatus]
MATLITSGYETIEPAPIPCDCVLRSLAEGLPEYSPSPPAPDYSHTPHGGEMSLQHASGPGFRFRNPMQTYTEHLGKGSLTLRGQEPGTRVPWYGRGETISGFITTDSPERVTTICMHVEGKLSISLGDGQLKVVTLVDCPMNLYRKGSPGSSGVCPAQLDFTFSLPRTYESQGKRYPLPPSFYEYSQENPYMNIRSWYRIRVTTIKAPKTVLGWEKIEQ